MLVVLYGCETWSRTLRAKHAEGFGEGCSGRYVRSVSAVARGDCRKLHSEDLHDMHFLPNIRAIKSERMRLAGPVARMGEFGTACRVLVGKPEGNNHS
jgi:hypothetical protein